MTTPKKTAAAPKAPAKPRKPAAPDVARLNGLIADIETNWHRNGDLIARLKAEGGLKIVFRNGTYEATMAGVRSSNTAGEAGALVNWAAAARRAVLKAGTA